MLVLIAPDKFKGSLTGQEAADAIASGLKRYDPNIETITQPLADGGEGTLDLLEEQLGLDRVKVSVSDPLFREIETYYLRKDDQAFVEMAFASGLQLLTAGERNCRKTSSLGTGELIRHAVENGCGKVSLFIGGSATNDAGIGIAQGLGFRFLDKHGKDLKPIGESLISIDQIKIPESLIQVSFEVICDVKNPLYGPEGAAYVYARQKGASEEDIEFLDKGLRHFATKLSEFKIDVAAIPGAGAAGGVGGGMLGLLDAKLISGIEFVIKTTRFSELAEKADLIISGEGKLDEQTLHGKVVAGVGAIASDQNKPFAIFCGVAADSLRANPPFNAMGLYEIMSDNISIDEAISNAASLLADRAYAFASSYRG